MTIGRSCWRLPAAGLAAAMLAGSSTPRAAEKDTPGATVESVVALARKLSPLLAAAALEA